MNSSIEVGFNNRKFMLKRFFHDVDSTKATTVMGPSQYLGLQDMVRDKMRASIRGNSEMKKQAFPVMLNHGQPIGFYEVMYD
mmetsp:Transcript_29534/g.44957  ORF Transcript_29534/g.44957 Transcript_29534/m.44957 type:complete len:82 (+) Transcript_29534:2232-2477(+)